MIDGIIFDIETGPLTPEQLEHRMPEFTAPANWKDEEKINRNIKEQQEKWTDKAALDAQTGEVLAIGLMFQGKATILDQKNNGGEKEVIKAFWDVVTKSTNRRFIGFNILNFDLPFLFRRSLVYGLTPSCIVRGNRYWDHRFVDLLDVYTCGNREQRISLDKLCTMLGLEGKTGSGADFHKWFKQEPAKARAYLCNDLEITAKVAERLLPWIETLKQGAIA
jgi:3'-5' exonuclease